MEELQGSAPRIYLLNLYCKLWSVLCLNKWYHSLSLVKLRGGPRNCRSRHAHQHKVGQVWEGACQVYKVSQYDCSMLVRLLYVVLRPNMYVLYIQLSYGCFCETLCRNVFHRSAWVGAQPWGTTWPGTICWWQHWLQQRLPDGRGKEDYHGVSLWSPAFTGWNSIHDTSCFYYIL